MFGSVLIWDSRSIDLSSSFASSSLSVREERFLSCKEGLRMKSESIVRRCQQGTERGWQGRIWESMGKKQFPESLTGGMG